jgi:hypothetical protein
VQPGWRPIRLQSSFNALKSAWLYCQCSSFNNPQDKRNPIHALSEVPTGRKTI